MGCVQSIRTSEDVFLDEKETSDEYRSSRSMNQPHVFDDIEDTKHKRYTDLFQPQSVIKDEEFWGLGVENESYFLLEDTAVPVFSSLRRKRERYSVDYYTNFREDDLQCMWTILLERTPYVPVYVNSHTFQSTDVKLEHRTLYDHEGTPNAKFTESIHDRLKRECAYYAKEYERSFTFDGDSIEIMTQGFYRATVERCVQELETAKRKFREAITPFFVSWNLGRPVYPEHNYGLVTFLSTFKRNVTPCNNGTIHINLTLPTQLHQGIVKDKKEFVQRHLRVVECVQMVEPLLVACYGTPDPLACIDIGEEQQRYALGSLRVAMSRYISLHTYNTSEPINGKLLLMKRPAKDMTFWYNQLHSERETGYLMNNEIGYDVNVNKFKNHGVELRFFDWFPEQYLSAVMSFLVLLAVHSQEGWLSPTCRRPLYSRMVTGCVFEGFQYRITKEDANHIILEDLRFDVETEYVSRDMTAYELLCHINAVLFKRYVTDQKTPHPILQRMAPHLLQPNAVAPILVNYNWIAYKALCNVMRGGNLPLLILRAEENPHESRTPLAPAAIRQLIQSNTFRVMVETSSARCYADDTYKECGAVIVPHGYWKTAPNAYVIGLKSLLVDATVLESQTHLFFGHCFKGQPGSTQALTQLQPAAAFIDYEFMMDIADPTKRVVSFCPTSGVIGASLAYMAYYQPYVDAIGFPEYDETLYRRLLTELRFLRRVPRVVIIGNGVVAHHARTFLERFGLTCDIWKHDDPKPRDVLLTEYDILINAISLRPDARTEVFLTEEDLLEGDPSRRLAVICDISCDLGNPRNTLPIYTSFTTRDHPVRRIRQHPPLDLIAMNYLPTLDPVRSSDQFSRVLVEYLYELPYFRVRRESSEKAMVLWRAEQVFRTHVSRI